MKPSVPAVAPSNWTLLRPYLFDIVGPLVAYLVAHFLGAAGVWAMTAAGLMAALSTAVNTIRRKRLDAVGTLVLLEIVAFVLVFLFVRDPRLLLVRPSVYTGLAAVYLGASAFVGRPLSFSGSRVMAARGGPARLAAFEQAWERSAEFRRTHRVVTFALGVCLAVDSVLRVVIVWHAPLERAAWLSNVPHVSALLLMAGLSALAGRRFARLVDEQMEATRAASAHG
jgi:hypothetical protein